MLKRYCNLCVFVVILQLSGEKKQVDAHLDEISRHDDAA